MKKTHSKFKMLLGVLAMSIFIFGIASCNNGSTGTNDTKDDDPAYSDPSGNGDNGGDNGGNNGDNGGNEQKPEEQPQKPAEEIVIEMKADEDGYIKLPKAIPANSGYTTLYAEVKYESETADNIGLQLVTSKSEAPSSGSLSVSKEYSIGSTISLAGASYIDYSDDNKVKACADEADGIRLYMQNSKDNWASVAGKIYIKKIWLAAYGKENLIIYKAEGADDTTPAAYKTVEKTFSYSDENTSFTLTAKADGTFSADITKKQEKSTASGKYLIKEDLLKVFVTTEKGTEIEYFRIKDDKLEIYTLDLSKFIQGYGDTASTTYKDGKLLITENNNGYFQVAIPYMPEFADGAAYISGTIPGYVGIGITVAPWSGPENDTYVSPTEPTTGTNLFNEEKGIYCEYFVIHGGGWIDTLIIDKIMIGPKIVKEDEPEPQPQPQPEEPEETVAFKITYNADAQYAAAVFTVEDDWKSLEVIFADGTSFDDIQFNAICDTVLSQESWGTAYYTTYPQISKAKNTLVMADCLNDLKSLSNNPETKLTKINIQNKTTEGFSVDVISAKVTKADGTVVSVTPTGDWGSSVK